MLLEYYHDMYLPTARREHELYADSTLARALADWKRKIPMRFSSLRFLEVSIEGIRGDTILVERPLDIAVRMDPGKLAPEEILVELIIGKKDGAGFAAPPERVPLKIFLPLRGRDPHCISFPTRSGKTALSLRHLRLPHHPHLAAKQETDLVYWG